MYEVTVKFINGAWNVLYCYLVTIGPDEYKFEGRDFKEDEVVLVDPSEVESLNVRQVEFDPDDLTMPVGWIE